jgi:hypothetical protein
MEELLKRITVLEQAHRRLKRALALETLALWSGAAVWMATCASSGAAPDGIPAPRLRTSELVVVDETGVERVRISGDLPDAVIRGRRVPRGSRAAGIALYDSTGQERGAYATFSPSDNVGLTLDTRASQAALFMADPNAGAALRLWNGGEEIALRADDDGAHISALQSRKVIFQEPPMASPNIPLCSKLRKLKGRLSDAELLAACSERMPESSCSACLSPP